jgi:hypothetical protein
MLVNHNCTKELDICHKLFEENKQIMKRGLNSH